MESVAALNSKQEKISQDKVIQLFEEFYPNFSQAFYASLQEQANLVAKKMLDDGMDNMKAGTNLKSEEDIKFALEGIWFRISDKDNRWKTLISSDRSTNNESHYDIFMDIANYAIFAKLISRGLWNEDKNS